MVSSDYEYRLSQLDQLEAESIHIFREATAELEAPVLMFSGGKDSIVMLRLAEKSFYPARIPFPVLQVDTGLDFPEVLDARDKLVERLGLRLIVASVKEAIGSGIVVDDGKTSRNRLQIGTLLHCIEKHRFTAAFGGGRRDEEKARARNAFTPTGTSLDNGIPRINDQNPGTCTMLVYAKGNTSESFRSRTGLNSMFGAI